jgi:L-alanine-DL-glutamate epimerase-like enolase superfamily enzyme
VSKRAPRPCVLPEIETGVGEVLGAPNNAAKIAVIYCWRPAIVGSRLHDTPLQCFAGIEFALWDAIGTEYGFRVHKLLGGSHVRGNVPFIDGAGLGFVLAPSG